MRSSKIESHRFPSDLAKQVNNKWNNFISGEYTPPPLPSLEQLRSLCEVVYLTTMETDEARPLKFTVCCTPKTDIVYRQRENEPIESLPFSTDRQFNIQELLRLASTVDLERSAIWVQFPDDPNQPLAIHGLMNLGMSWSVARNAFVPL